jgi:hypothetical protein
MFQYVTGNIDVPGASVMVVLFICMALAATTYMATYTSEEQQKRTFEIERLKLDNQDRQSQRVIEKETKVELGNLALKKEIEFKRIDSGMLDLKNVKSTTDNG